MRGSPVAIAIVLALLAAGCGSPNAGSAAHDEIRGLLETEYGDHVEEIRLSAHNTLPFLGDASGSVVLTPDTPPVVFAEVLDLMASFEPDHGAFEGTGVVANGVGVCFEDPQWKERQALRDALHAADASLAGEWPCGTRLSTNDTTPYAGTVADLDADVRLVRAVAGQTALTLEATLEEPTGTVSGPLDELPLTLANTLVAVDRAHGVVDFEYADDRLRVAVTPTSDLTPVQAAASRAAGPDLPVTVLRGSLDPTQQKDYARVAPVADALRAIPGVDEVTAQQQSVTLRLLDPKLVRQVHDAASDVPGVDELGMTIHVGEGSFATGALEWSRPIGGRSQGIDTFATLVTRPDVERLRVREAGGGQERWIFLELAGPLTDAAQLRDVLPVGVRARILSVADNHNVELTIADELNPQDLRTSHDDVDLDAFVAAWNAAS